MRVWHIGILLCLVFLAQSLRSDGGEPAVAGKWKVFVLAFGDDEFFIVDLEKKDAALAGSVVDAQRFLPNLKLTKGAVKDGKLQLDLDADGQPTEFNGALNDEANKAFGIFRFRGTLYPAHIEKTDGDKVAATDRTLIRSIFGALDRRIPPAKRVEQLGTLIHTNKGNATLYHAYEGILKSATKAKLSGDDVKKYLNQWLEEARPHGPLWLAECRAKALTALNGQEDYAPATMDVAVAAEKNLPADVTLETKSDIARTLAWAAAAAGRADLAKDADARHKAIEATLDEKYFKEVPPFAAEKFAGRKDAKANRAVLLELFTGAQCPPCIAVDVAFDALLKTYKTKDLVTLQYHLHIPGPDPLTNDDSLARATYYGVESTPSLFLNGQAAAEGGGGMTESQAKYQELLGLINDRLENTAAASIKLQAQQMDDSIVVKAKAEAEAKEGAKLRLRLALTEESVRYVGGNKLRFHHHVVRALLGGAEGAAFDKGAANVEIKLSLTELRKALNDYLDRFSEMESFPRPRPPIQLEGLSVVALVQDDATKQILHAVAVPIAAAK